MSTIIVDAVQTSEAYGMSGYSRIVESKGKTYLIRDEWCGGEIEGKCFREHAYLIPDSLVTEAIKALQGDQKIQVTDTGVVIPGDAEWFWQNHINDLQCLGRNRGL